MGAHGEDDPAAHPRVAVLPFRNISPDPAGAYLAEGFTEEITSTLAKVPGLDVVSRASALRYRNVTDKTSTEIGRELRAGSLLDGSVRKSGGRIRITAHFVDAPTDRQIWGEAFDGDPDDLFGVQKGIAAGVARALSERLGTLPATTTRRRPTPSAEAYLLFLKGRVAYREATREGLERAVELFRRALERDPDYVDALAAIASSYRRIGFWEISYLRDGQAKAREYAERALALDPTHPEARLNLVQLHRSAEWDFEAAEREVRQILMADPRHAEAHENLAGILTDRGLLDEAAREALLGIELDPQSSTIREWAGTALLYARKYPEAVATFRVALELDPKNGSALHNLGPALIQVGSVTEGIAAMEEVLHRSDSPSPLQLMELAYGHGRAGHSEKVEGILCRILREAESRPVWWAGAAGVYASTGRIDEAFDALDKAFAAHAAFLGAHLCKDFLFDPIRGDPRMEEILRKLGASGRSPSAGRPDPSRLPRT